MDYERVPWSKRRSEQRKRDAALRYELEMESRKVGWQDPALVYDEEKDLFRFRDGRFAFSREHGYWARESSSARVGWAPIRRTISRCTWPTNVA